MSSLKVGGGFDNKEKGSSRSKNHQCFLWIFLLFFCLLFHQVSQRNWIPISCRAQSCTERETRRRRRNRKNKKRKARRRIRLSKCPFSALRQRAKAKGEGKSPEKKKKKKKKRAEKSHFEKAVERRTLSTTCTSSCSGMLHSWNNPEIFLRLL